MKNSSRGKNKVKGEGSEKREMEMRLKKLTNKKKVFHFPIHDFDVPHIIYILFHKFN
jgi:hypothetical protein